MPRKPQPECPDADAPEADAAWFERARPASEVLPALFGDAAAQTLLKPRRGRPRAAATKEHINIRLDADIVQSFRSTGEGWQTRLNDALREWLKAHAS